jgi:hypothetical protein
MQERAPDVQVMAPVKQEDDRKIGGKARRCHGSHQHPLDRCRVLQALPGLPDDPRTDGDEEEGVDECGKDLGPVETVGAPPGGDLPGQRQRHEREDERQPSLNMWPASESSASDPAWNPPASSMMKKTMVIRSAAYSDPR